MLSCLSDIADKKRKVEVPFRNTKYEKKLSKVAKSIERQLMDVLKREQKNDKVFICNNIPKIISDI